MTDAGDGDGGGVYKKNTFKNNIFLNIFYTISYILYIYIYLYEDVSLDVNSQSEPNREQIFCLRGFRRRRGAHARES